MALLNINPTEYASVTGVSPSIEPPVLTTSSSEQYVLQSALVASHASQDDPLSVLFQMEKGSLPTTPTREQIREVTYRANLLRLEKMLGNGGFVAESGNFAAVACWSPPDAMHETPTEQDLQELERCGRWHFATFLRQIDMAKRKHLYSHYGHKYWHIALMARDPRRPYVAGAVRAVIVPFIEKAQEQQMPIWLEAGGERAKNVYQHYGFEVVELMMVQGVSTWCMIYRPRHA